MSDRDLAVRLREAVELFNRVIGECQEANLRVEAAIVNTRDFQDYWDVPHLQATIYRPVTPEQ